jgi:hypothetical protein
MASRGVSSTSSRRYVSHRRVHAATYKLDDYSMQSDEFPSPGHRPCSLVTISPALSNIHAQPRSAFSRPIHDSIPPRGPNEPKAGLTRAGTHCQYDLLHGNTVQACIINTIFRTSLTATSHHSVGHAGYQDRATPQRQGEVTAAVGCEARRWSIIAGPFDVRSNCSQTDSLGRLRA